MWIKSFLELPAQKDPQKVTFSANNNNRPESCHRFFLTGIVGHRARFTSGSGGGVASTAGSLARGPQWLRSSSCIRAALAAGQRV
mmetsp:Transcript_101548/g.163759  ORF Transcript_101548/g.163759 Transcript_101548/m.163759 type:complete len:85 (-) Transcript_101548:2128-2382(-)